jgi:U3 small nucleolar RNA-associated protein 4
MPSIQRSGHLHPKRIRDFASILIAQLPKSTSSSTGGLSFQFTPDSSKLVMSTVVTACILVIDLSSEKPHVLRRFDHHRRPHPVVRERVVKGLKGNDDGDVDMTNLAADSTEGEYQPPTSALVNILRMSISPDGQWLASSDERSRTHVFNLDSIQVRPCLRAWWQSV